MRALISSFFYVLLPHAALLAFASLSLDLNQKSLLPLFNGNTSTLPPRTAQYPTVNGIPRSYSEYPQPSLIVEGVGILLRLNDNCQFSRELSTNSLNRTTETIAVIIGGPPPNVGCQSLYHVTKFA